MIDARNPNEGKRIGKDSVEYLCFEGGGGKGSAYLGIIKGLEEKFGQTPLIDYRKNPTPENRKIKGISGASAGAITAFMLAMGMSAADIANQLKRMADTEIGRNIKIVGRRQAKIVPVVKKVGIFETFFETMRNSVVNKNRVVENGMSVREYVVKRPGWFKYIDIIFGIFVSSRRFEDSFLLKKLFLTPFEETSTADSTSIEPYLHSLLAYRGLFSGMSVRQYFVDLLEENIRKRLTAVTDSTLKSRVKRKGLDITFEDFFNYFGCDLVITGTNVSQHMPKYFSVYATPSFPVIDAVCLSMNLPVIFKPIFVDYAVHKYKGDKNSDYNSAYKGLWVDGGMLNNYPIHAFDRMENFSHNGVSGGFNFLTSVNHINYEVAANTVASESDFNEKVLGFRLVDFTENKEVKTNEIFSQTEYYNILPYMGDLLKTFMYSGGQGQIRNSKQQSRTIYVNAQDLDVVDFSPLRQNFFIHNRDTNADINNPIEHRIVEAYESIDRILV